MHKRLNEGDNEKRTCINRGLNLSEAQLEAIYTEKMPENRLFSGIKA